MKRVVSNIQNLGFTIMNEDTGEKKSAAGITLDQTVVNEQSQGVSVRLINGGRKSAAVKLDRSSLESLHEALTEVLSIEQA